MSHITNSVRCKDTYWNSRLNYRLGELHQQPFKFAYKQLSSEAVSEVETNEPPPQPDLLATYFANRNKETPEGEEIHENIAKNWTELLTKGLEKEERKTLLSKYPPAKNCPRLTAPTLNKEILVCIKDPTQRQDQFLKNTQDQLGCALAALAIPLNTLLNNPTEATNGILPALVDASKLMTDLHHTTSRHRRYLLGPHLNPQHKKTLDEAPIDSNLFGENLAETIKDSQQVTKTSSDLALGKMGPSKPSTAFKRQPHLNSKRVSAKFIKKKSREGNYYGRTRSRSPQARNQDRDKRYRKPPQKFYHKRK